MAKNIVVTGATGFVGGFVATYLESKGYTVFRFGRKPMENVKSWDITQGLYKNDLTIDCVVHCAALVDDWASYRSSYTANVTGTINVLRSFPGVSQFIYISSASVYDSFCRQVTISEDDCLGGKILTNYGKTKLQGEREVQKSPIGSKVILRPHIIYGPGDTTIGPRIKEGIRFRRFPIIGNGKNRISFTHVENLAQAIEQSIVLSKSGTSVYNITDMQPRVFIDAVRDFKKLNHLTFKEIYIPRSVALVIALILEVVYTVFRVNKSPLITRYIVGQMSSDHVLDISKAKEELRYHPVRNTAEDFLLY